MDTFTYSYLQKLTPEIKFKNDGSMDEIDSKLLDSTNLLGNSTWKFNKYYGNSIQLVGVLTEYCKLRYFT